MLIFSAVAGSRLYGLHNENSDNDVRGVFLAPRNQILGVSDLITTQQLEGDTVYHELRKFLNLAIKGNPAIIELLFTPRTYWLSNEPYWLDIYNHRGLFLTDKTKEQYLGYIRSEINTLEKWNRLHPQPELKKRASHVYRLLHQLESILKLRDFNPTLEGAVLTTAREIRYNGVDMSDLLEAFKQHYFALSDDDSTLPKTAPVSLISDICEHIYLDWLKV